MGLGGVAIAVPIVRTMLALTMRLAWLTGVLLLLAPSWASASDTCVCWTGLDTPQSVAGEWTPERMRRLVELRAARASADVAEETRSDAGLNEARSHEVARVAVDGSSEPAGGVVGGLTEEALSRPLDEIASLPLAPAAERVLWCDGSDDPRCTPGNPVPTSAEVASGPPGAPVAALSAPSLRSRSSTRHGRVGLAPYAAGRGGLDRPPRA